MMTCDYKWSAGLSWRGSAYFDDTGRPARFVRYVRLVHTTSGYEGEFGQVVLALSPYSDHGPLLCQAMPVFFYPSLFARTCIAFKIVFGHTNVRMNLLMIDLLHFPDSVGIVIPPQSHPVGRTAKKHEDGRIRSQVRVRGVRPTGPP